MCTLGEGVLTFMISSWIILKIENVSVKAVEKIKAHGFILITFFRKSCRLWDNVGKYSNPRQARDDNIIRLKHTHAEYIILVFHDKNISLTRLSITLYVRCLSFVSYFNKQLKKRNN